jgi:hypothetical protein
MRPVWITALVLFPSLCGLAGYARADKVNLLVNPDFDNVYAARRLPSPNSADRNAERRMWPKFLGKPALPYGWAVVAGRDQAATISRVEDGGRKALRVQVPKDESLQLVQRYVEVVPGATYDFGLAAKGSGRVDLAVWAAEPAPDETLMMANIAAGPQWQKIAARKQVGPHRHLARYTIVIGGPADVMVRQAEVSVQAAAPARANPLLVKAARDADTLFYEDFDGPSQVVALGAAARLTDEGGGRFGRGLITSAGNGGAITHLSAGELPPQYTIEFWFKPAALPAAAGFDVPLAITTQTPGMSQTQIEFHAWPRWFGFGFRQQYRYDRANAEMTGVGWWQPETWHHLAGSWDGDAMRLYVDGVLEGICYGKDQMVPRGTALDLVLPLDGVIDEIRISKGLRFGPIVPAGVKQVALSLPTTTQPPIAPAAKEVTEEELQSERAKRIAPVPQSSADYTFAASLAHPAWEGMGGLTFRRDYFGKGLDAIEAQAWPQKIGRSVRWRIEKIEPGDYYVGLWAETANAGLRTEYGPDRLLASAYLNGWPVRFATTTDPVQVRPGVWLAELQSGSPVSLKDGDELAVWPVRQAERQCFLRLALYRKAPGRGHGVTGQTFGVDCGNPQRLRLVLSPEIKGSGEDGTPHEARIEVANPLPYAVEAQLRWKLADYYGAPLVERTEPVCLGPHRATVVTYAFTACGDAQGYQLDTRTCPVPGFKLPVPRPREMWQLSDYSCWEFQPNQPHPLTAWNHVRVDLKGNRSGQRKWLCLDGDDWQWAYLDGRRVPATVPAGLAWSQGSVPFLETWIKLPPGRFGKWFRKTVTLPAWLKGDRYLLELSEVNCEATIFVNGRPVGYGAGALPVVADITAALKPGAANDLAICVRGGIGVMKPEFVDQYDPENWRIAQENEDVYHDSYGIPCLKSVHLRAVPEVQVKQSLVVSDVEQGRLRIMTRLENAGSRLRQVTLRSQAFQTGRAVAVPIPEKSVTIPAGAVVEVAVESPAGELAPWTPRNPVLAKMVTTVVENGRVLDTFERRFGYRSLRVKGMKLLLNGKPVRFFGGCNGPAPHDFLEADCAVNFLRGQGASADLWDEIGVPYLYTVYNCGDKTWKKLSNKKYWDTWRHFVLETVWNQGSRAGTVGWDLSCESFYTIYTAGKEGQEKDFELIYSPAQEMRQKIWPHYFCMADGDGSLGGRLDFASYHYWNQYSFGGKPDECGFTYEWEGILPYLPDGFFLNGAAQVPRNGTLLHMVPDWIYGTTACGSTEDFEFFGPQNGVPLSKYVGDRAAISGAYTANDPHGMAWTKISLDGNRDMDQAIAGCVYWNSFYGTADQYVSFCMPQQEIRYYAGSRFDRRLNLHDDEGLPGELVFRWTLLHPSGQVARQGEIRAKSDGALLQRDRLAFDVPEVAARTGFTLVMGLWKGETKWAREERLVDVWPRVEESRAATGRAVVLFDPNKKAVARLAALGCAVKPIASLDAAALAGAQCLVIGPDCVTPQMVDKRYLLRDFARDGGRVLVLHQDDPSLLPADVMLDKRAWPSIGFVRAEGHPVMHGMQDRDFQMWNPRHVIAKGAFRKPDKGAFLTLVDSGHDDAAARAEMLEFYVGQGSVLATQLTLTDNFDTEPMAAELLRRLLAYLAQPVFRVASSARTGSPLAIVNGASEAVLKRLSEVRTEYATVAGTTPGQDVTLIDLGVDHPPGDATAWRAYIQQGGTLVVHRATPKHQPWLEALTARKVDVEVQPYQAWVDRQMLQRRDGLATGLDNLDLYWRTQTSGEGPEDHWQVSCGVEKGQERGQVQYVVKVDGASDYLFPGGLVEILLGKGRVIVDQVKWETSNREMICGSPARYLSVLLTNLGISRRLPAPKPVLPKGVTCEPIDLASVANRGFQDDKAGDGVGWLDWGPDADLSSFPTGNVNLGGVPYLVPSGDKNAIVLRVNPDFVPCLANYPDSVAIPVNKRRVAGLYFLHTGGWAYGPAIFGRRRIEYADGTAEIIDLSGANMADWNPGADSFPDEDGTLTTVAWKGANARYPVVRVYQTLWINPHPEKTIKQIVLSNTGLDAKQWRFMPHFGLTAAILPPPVR